MDDPVRLIDDPSTPEALRADLEAVRALAPAPIDLEGGAARLEQAASASGAGALTTGAVVTGVVIVRALAGAGAWATLRSSAPPERPQSAPYVRPGEPAREERARETTEQEVLPSPEPASARPHGSGPETHVPETHAPEPTPARRDAPHGEVRSARASRPAQPSPPAPDGLREEMLLTARARAALASQPAQTLALAEEGNRRFAGGYYAEEREALAVLALSALHRDAEARARGARFLGAHPRSTPAERVRRALAQLP